MLKPEKILTSKFNQMLDEMAKHPEKVTEDDKNALSTLYSKLCKSIGISEHTQWRVEWKVEKWIDSARKLAGFAPDDVVMDTQNIVLNDGANEMLKLITGTGTAFSAANAYIYVGTDSTAENASQTGVLATGSNRAYAAMDTGYPVVAGRQATFRATFGDESANFAWNELSITNGTGANAVSLNRKVPTPSMGVKTTGTWTIEVKLTLASA